MKVERTGIKFCAAIRKLVAGDTDLLPEYPRVAWFVFKATEDAQCDSVCGKVLPCDKERVPRACRADGCEDHARRGRRTGRCRRAVFRRKGMELASLVERPKEERSYEDERGKQKADEFSAHVLRKVFNEDDLERYDGERGITHFGIGADERADELHEGRDVRGSGKFQDGRDLVARELLLEDL